MSNFIKILSLFNTQPNRPRASPAIFKHVGQVPYSRGFKFGEKAQIKILPHFLSTGPALSIFIQILSLFNTQPIPRASTAIFKHVGQVPYSSGFKFGEKGPIKILPHFCLQVRRCRISPKFKVFSTHNLIGLGLRQQFLSMEGRSPTQGASNLGKRLPSKFSPFLPTCPALTNFIKFKYF